MASPTPREIAMEARKREFDAKRRAANRQKGANLLGMASNPGALLRGALDIPGSVYRYLRDNEPVEIGEDVSRIASDMAGDFRKDPVKFAVDMVNPVTSVQDFADIRAQARDLRAAGDLDTASMLEQVAAMSPLAVVPVVGKVLGKGAKTAAKKAASLAVKPAMAAAERASLAVERAAQPYPAPVNLNPLSEKQFYRRYLAHKDLRSKTPEQKAEVLKSVQDEGFRSGWVLPAYRGGEPQNVIDEGYAPRKGDRVYLVPLSTVNEKRGRPLTITAGWKPAPYESVDVEEDYQPLYDLYRKAFEKQNLTNKAHGGRVLSLAVKRKGKK